MLSNFGFPHLFKERIYLEWHIVLLAEYEKLYTDHISSVLSSY